MLLDLEDLEIRASIRQTSRNSIRLTLDYPNEEQHRNKVMAVISELIRPCILPSPVSNAAPAETEAIVNA